MTVWLGFCTGISPAAAQVYVSYNPYADVDWESDNECLTQLHDHLYTEESNYRAYDDAGYQAVSVMHYSGVMATYQKSAWHERHWPLSQYLEHCPSDEAFLSTCRNLRILIPNGEEVGFDHVISPFMTDYIAKWEPAYYPQREPWHYASTNECLSLIKSFDGLAFIAHPWGLPTPNYYYQFESYTGIEIYSAHAAYSEVYGGGPDLNARLQGVWDALLTHKSSQTWGVAVNDWYGPNWTQAAAYPDISDSGKILVFVKSWSLAALQDSIARGAFFAIRDIGVPKRRYPTVSDISIEDGVISITTNGEVRWISNRVPVAVGPELNINTLLAQARYVRAEISNASGTVYVQPFSLGHPPEIPPPPDPRNTPPPPNFDPRVITGPAQSSPECDPGSN